MKSIVKNQEIAAPAPAPLEPPAAGKRGMGTAAKVIVSACLVYYWVAVFTWLLPQSELKGAITPYVSSFMILTGLWQGWDMFSPDPDKTNAYVTAEITYRDGRKRVYELPHMPDLNYWSRYQKERYRKWGMERARIDEFRFCWPDTARWVARINNDLPDNPPVHVELTRYWYFVPPPSGDISQPIPKVYNSYMYYALDITPKDL